MKPLTPEERETAGSMLHAAASENAAQSLIEKYGRAVIQQYEYLDLHPEYSYFLLASGENCINEMCSEREYSEFGLPRPATPEEAQAIYDASFEGWLLARKQQNAPMPKKKRKS